MRCPYCFNKTTRVIDKRETSNQDVTRRRRECVKCKKRFTTYERVETSNIYVIKKDGSKELFNRQKVLAGILKACEKRQISPGRIKKIVDQIEAKIKSYKKNEVPSKIIGELVIKKLKSLDKVAYVRFASVYKSFDDIDSFDREIRKLKKEKSK
ncbi:transcriptional regulator NrdR [Candidatus Woesearchaeota archaeon]|nr:MAG: transcriptional regulator NrdR [Candidatus Woesearchaeota archaeon]